MAAIKRIIKDIKKGFVKHPCMVTWRVLMLPLVCFATMIFIVSLVIFNLGFSEAKEFINDAF